MSLDEHERDPDTQLEVQTERRVPFTMVGDWVLLSKLSPMAKLLYALLQAHVNVSDDTGKVWPSRDTLAEWMGFDQARSVGKYIDELEAFGAIRKEQRRTSGGLRTRNVYYVRGEAPEAITTPIRFSDYYAARRATRDAISAGQPVGRSSAPRPDQQNSVSAGDDVVRPSAPRSAPQRHDVVRPSAPELDQELQQEKEGGEREAPIDQPSAGTPDPTGPPTPLKANWKKPETWLCQEHLELLASEPGADRPACAKCMRVRQWAEAKQAQHQQLEAAAAADEAKRARNCRWHDDAGWVLDPDEPSEVLSPAVKCDHRRTPAEVKAAIPTPPPAHYASAAVRRRAQRIAGLSNRSDPEPDGADLSEPGSGEPEQQAAARAFRPTGTSQNPSRPPRRRQRTPNPANTTTARSA